MEKAGRKDGVEVEEDFADLLQDPVLLNDGDPNIGVRVFKVRNFIFDLIKIPDYDRAAACLQAAKAALDSRVYGVLTRKVSKRCLDMTYEALRAKDFETFGALLSFVKATRSELYYAVDDWDLSYFIKYFRGPLQAENYDEAFAFLDAIQPHCDTGDWEAVSRAIIIHINFLTKRCLWEQLRILANLTEDRPITPAAKTTLVNALRQCPLTQTLEDLLGDAPVVADSEFAALLESATSHELEQARLYICNLIDGKDFRRAVACFQQAQEVLSTELYGSLVAETSAHFYKIALDYLEADDIASFGELFGFAMLPVPALHEVEFQWGRNRPVKQIGALMESGKYIEAFDLLSVMAPYLDNDYFKKINMSVQSRVGFLIKGKRLSDLGYLYSLMLEVPSIPLKIKKDAYYALKHRRDKPGKKRRYAGVEDPAAPGLTNAESGPKTDDAASAPAIRAEARRLLSQDPNDVEGLSLAFRYFILTENLEGARRVNTRLEQDPDDAAYRVRMAALAVLEDTLKEDQTPDRGKQGGRRTSPMMSPGEVFTRRGVRGASSLVKGSTPDKGYPGAKTKGAVHDPDIK